ncbi:MAG TPA: hypothetical protein VLH83_04975 [Chthoniobacterales bacterium]|nr:hypothetical protein [Chthoniobacterales bacterium]
MGVPDVTLWNEDPQIHCTVSPALIETVPDEKDIAPPGPTVTLTVAPLPFVTGNAEKITAPSREKTDFKVALFMTISSLVPAFPAEKNPKRVLGSTLRRARKKK